MKNFKLLLLAPFLLFQGLMAGPLHKACERSNPFDVKAAIQSGADVNELHEGQTPLSYVVAFAWFHKLALNYAEQLLRAGADVNRRDQQANTPLHIVAEHSNDNHHLAFLLFEYGANQHLKNKEGNTPLHLASMSGGYQVVDYILSAGAQVNGKNNKGMTPLHLACEYGNPLAVRNLLERGADTGAVNNNGERPKDICCRMANGDDESIAEKKREILDLLENTN